jgi:2-dehydro-3-deoxyphosphogluconate aldolase/(4S)-4-hydroxy-2-oxoglutarate aldolase
MPQLVEEARRANAACVLGGLTPTEVMKAWQAGPDQVKVFPVARLGGPAYLRDLAGPFPQVRLMASGGIVLDDLPNYCLPNVASIGLGSELVPASAMSSGDAGEIRRRAERAIALLQ